MHLSYQSLIAIGLGGFIGAILRALAVHYTNRFFPLEFPIGVLLVNVIGSFVIGILFAYFSHFDVSTTIKSFLTTGLLGALTTYSTFAIETHLLFLNKSAFLAVANIVLNILGTILAAGAGYKLFHFIIK